MRIVCPKCELKGQVDVATASAKTRIACVRCATTFDAIFVDGQIQVLLPQASHVEMALESVGSDVSVAAAVDFPVETKQESQLNFASQLASTSASTDDFSASSTDVVLDETLEASSSVWPQETAQELAWPNVETQAQETHDDRPSVSVFEPPLKAVEASKVSQPSDAYGLGVHLMRVSPMWLLLAGLSFISFIVLCNWLLKPNDGSSDAPRTLVVADNHATNQSPARVVMSDSKAQSPVNSQAAQPSTQSAASFIPAEAKEATAAKATPNAATIEKPAVEEKAPASNSHEVSEAKAGKVTVQLGSYNEAAQAEERVASLKSAGYEARSVTVEIPKRGTWYRVQSGRFVNRDEAERYGKQLRDKGVVTNYITTDVQE
jgi:cell division protein FtsN